MLSGLRNKEPRCALRHPPLIRLEDYRPTDYLIETVDLDIRLAPDAARIVSRLSIRPRESTPPHTPLVLDGDGLVLKSVSLEFDTPLADSAYEATPDRLTLHAPPADRFQLEVVTEANPSANTALMGLYLSNGIYTTQCEAEGFRRITYFLDRPDVLAVYHHAHRGRAERSTDPPLQRQPGRERVSSKAGPSLCGLARSLPEAELPLRPRRRRARLDPRHLHARAPAVW